MSTPPRRGPAVIDFGWPASWPPPSSSSRPRMSSAANATNINIQLPAGYSIAGTIRDSAGAVLPTPTSPPSARRLRIRQTRCDRQVQDDRPQGRLVSDPGHRADRRNLADGYYTRRHQSLLGTVRTCDEGDRRTEQDGDRRKAAGRTSRSPARSPTPVEARSPSRVSTPSAERPSPPRTPMRRASTSSSACPPDPTSCR